MWGSSEGCNTRDDVICKYSRLLVDGPGNNLVLGVNNSGSNTDISVQMMEASDNLVSSICTTNIDMVKHVSIHFVAVDRSYGS